jgi:hypothetical protein
MEGNVKIQKNSSDTWILRNGPGNITVLSYITLSKKVTHQIKTAV